MRRFAPLLFPLILGACGLLPDWLGAPEPPPLPGERLSVLPLGTVPEPDPRFEDLAVRLPPPQPTPNWPQAGGFPDHAMHHVAVPGPLQQAWVADVGEGSSSERRLLAPPVVADGRVFALDANSRITALDANTGERLWRVNLTPKRERGGGLGGGLAVYRGRVYAATGYGEVVALDAATSEPAWRRSLGAAVRSPPAVSRGRVFTVTYDNQLYALAAEDGRVLWTHEGIEEVAGLLGGASPAVADELVVAAYSSGEIYALRVENGRVAWSHSLSFTGRVGAVSAIGDIDGSPVIDRGLVFAVSHGGLLVAVDLRRGVRLWEQDLSGIQTPWVAGDFIYMVTADGVLVCLAREQGGIVWVRPLPRFLDPDRKRDPVFWSGPILVSDRLIVVGTHGVALSVSPYTGRVLGRFKLPSGTEIPPIAAGGTLFILTGIGKLVALR